MSRSQFIFTSYILCSSLYGFNKGYKQMDSKYYTDKILNGVIFGFSQPFNIPDNVRQVEKKIRFR